MDGKYIRVKPYDKKISLIWGADYLTHDIPHFRLSPAENYHCCLSFFKSLRLLNYPLQCLVSDDNVSFKLAALKIYPKAVIQTCTNHFVKQLETLFSKKRSEIEFNSLAGKLYSQWKHDQIVSSVLIDLAKRKPELTAYTKIPQTPYTTNLIEAYNSHLQCKTAEFLLIRRLFWDGAVSER